MGTTAKGYPYPEGTDLVMEGDDAIQALAEAVDAKLPYSTATGNGSFPETATGSGSNLTVSFPPGRFTVAPTVVTNTNTSAPHNRFTTAQSVAVTSFVARFVNTGGAAGVGFNWIAIQQDAAAALLAVRTLAADDDGMTYMTVACPNPQCPYHDTPIDAILTFTDDEGNVQTTGEIQCGGCGTVLWTPDGGDGS